MRHFVFLRLGFCQKISACYIGFWKSWCSSTARCYCAFPETASPEILRAVLSASTELGRVMASSLWYQKSFPFDRIHKAKGWNNSCDEILAGKLFDLLPLRFVLSGPFICGEWLWLSEVPVLPVTSDQPEWHIFFSQNEFATGQHMQSERVRII